MNESTEKYTQNIDRWAIWNNFSIYVGTLIMHSTQDCSQETGRGECPPTSRCFTILDSSEKTNRGYFTDFWSWRPKKNLQNFIDLNAKYTRFFKKNCFALIPLNLKISNTDHYIDRIPIYRTIVNSLNGCMRMEMWSIFKIETSINETTEIHTITKHRCDLSFYPCYAVRNVYDAFILFQ